MANHAGFYILNGAFSDASAGVTLKSVGCAHPLVFGSLPPEATVSASLFTVPDTKVIFTSGISVTVAEDVSLSAEDGLRATEFNSDLRLLVPSGPALVLSSLHGTALFVAIQRAEKLAQLKTSPHT